MNNDFCFTSFVIIIVDLVEDSFGNRKMEFASSRKAGLRRFVSFVLERTLAHFPLAYQEKVSRTNKWD